MKYIYKLSGYYLLTVLTVFFISSCGTTDEVRTVEEGPRTSTERTPSQADTTEPFMEITIGAIDPVDNLDPLFANNLSTMRILSLIYDGLFTLDRDGAVVNAIASETSVSDDSLTYTISLNNNLFFHDNSAFMSGVGRRLQASDIKWAFERTARATVPTQASRLLMNIEGYEEYYEDQRNIFDSERRALEGVSGIIVNNSQSIEFRLTEPDPEFLRKLASPYLFIYPREAVQRQGQSLKTNPVGTGAYAFQNRSDNSVVLAKDDSDRVGDRLTEPRVNRIEFLFNQRESQLFQNFARGTIDWIPESGPEIKRTAITAEGELASGYRDNYELHSAGARHIIFYLNETRRVNISWLNNRLADFEPDSIDTENTIHVHQIPPSAGPDEAGDPDSFYLVTFTNEFFTRDHLANIQQQYLEPESEFRLSNIRTPFSRSAIYTVLSDSFHYPFITQDRQPWLTFISPVWGLYHTHVEGIENHTVPWKLFIEQIRTEHSNGGSQ